VETAKERPKRPAIITAYFKPIKEEDYVDPPMVPKRFKKDAIFSDLSISDGLGTQDAPIEL
jgi:hypothetical protein